MFKIDVSIKILNDKVSLDIFLFGSDKYKDTVNKEILVHTINLCKTSKPFERPLFDRWYYFMTTFLNFFSSFTLVLKIWCSNFDFSQPIFFKSRIFFLFLNNASQVLLGVSIYLCSTSPSACFQKWVLGDLLWNVLIFVI